VRHTAALVALVLLTASPPAAAARLGRLPPEVIQRVMRAAMPRFRHCYEESLRPCPNLQGRVAVAFVIERDGSVSHVRGESDLPNERLVSCVVDEVGKLTFPAPEGGCVAVRYPIMFSPGSPQCGSRRDPVP
jgi:hypothetical protein